MSQRKDDISDVQFQEALKTLLYKTKGMRENVDEALVEFKQAAYPYSDNALQMLVDEGYLDQNLRATPDKGGVLDEIHQVFFSHMGEGERTMPDGVQVVWDALCSCYVLSPEEERKVANSF